MKLLRVSRGWYETPDGRHAVLRSRSRWCIATTCRNGNWEASWFQTKREAASALAQRIQSERTVA